MGRLGSAAAGDDGRCNVMTLPRVADSLARPDRNYPHAAGGRRLSSGRRAHIPGAPVRGEAGGRMAGGHPPNGASGSLTDGTPSASAPNAWNHMGIN